MLGFLKLYALFMAHTGIWYCLILNAKDGNKKLFQNVVTTTTAMTPKIVWAYHGPYKYFVWCDMEW